MVKDLFEDKKSDYKKDRILSIFTPKVSGSKKDPEINTVVVEAFDEVVEVTDLLGQAIEQIEKHGEHLLVPIEDDDNEVRAAHLRQGGDGKFITFAQFKHAINVVKRSRADYAFNVDPRKNPGNVRRKRERNQITRNLKDYADSGGGIPNFDFSAMEMGGFGLQSLLMYGLNELLGSNHAQDHSNVVSGKYPPSTETGSVISQMIRGMIMSRMLHGMTEQAMLGYSKLDDVKIEGADIESIVKEAWSKGPPTSKSFQLMRAGLAGSDHEILAHHCSQYTATHIGDGFETWWAYMSTRELHERGLRESNNARLYREGFLTGSEGREKPLFALADAGISALSNIQQLLGRDLNPRDACCLTRFLSGIDIDFLESLRVIIESSKALLEIQAQDSMSQTLTLMMSGMEMIRSYVVKMMDGVIDKVINEVIDFVNIDGDIADIIRKCTPVQELMTGVVDQMEFVKDWYEALLNQIMDDTEEFTRNQTEMFYNCDGILRAKGQLEAIDLIIKQKQGMIEASSSDSQMMATIEELRSLRKTYKIDVNVLEQVVKGMRQLNSSSNTREDKRRIIDRIDGRMQAAGVSGYDRAQLTARLTGIADTRDDSKLNTAINFAEKTISAVGVDADFSGANDFTREMVEWCRNLGDWDKMKGMFGVKPNEEPEVS